MPGAATVQPAALARGLRRVLLDRGVVIHERTTVEQLDGQRPGPLGGVRAGSRRAAVRRGTNGGFRPVRVRTPDGEVMAGSAIVAVNAWAAGWPAFGSRLVASGVEVERDSGDPVEPIRFTVEVEPIRARRERSDDQSFLQAGS